MLRYGHRTGLYVALVVAIASIVFLILLIARNTRQVKVDYVFGDTQARLIWFVIISAIAGWVLGIVTAFLIRRRTRWRGRGDRGRCTRSTSTPRSSRNSSAAAARPRRSGSGDKSAKYRKGMIVQVLAGTRFSPRERVFDAVIDKVEVKALAELSPREIEHDNPEIRRTEDMASFLSQLYNREVTPDDTVTVIRFSQIKD